MLPYVDSSSRQRELSSRRATARTLRELPRVDFLAPQCQPSRVKTAASGAWRNLSIFDGSTPRYDRFTENATTTWGSIPTVDNRQMAGAPSTGQHLPCVDRPPYLQHGHPPIANPPPVLQPPTPKPKQRPGHCVEGFFWYKVKGGYRCFGGNHAVPNSLVEKGSDSWYEDPKRGIFCKSFSVGNEKFWGPVSGQKSGLRYRHRGPKPDRNGNIDNGLNADGSPAQTVRWQERS